MMRGFACLLETGCDYKGACQDAEHCIGGQAVIPEGKALNAPRRVEVGGVVVKDNLNARRCTFDNTGEGHCLHAGCEPAGFCLEKHPGARLVTYAANPKDAMGAAKVQMGLVPLVEAVARVMELGAKKYGPYNWRSKAVKKMVYVHAALRHLMAWVGGQSTDPESGESHLAHVAACMLIVLDAEAHGKAIEDRVWLPGDKP